MTNLNQLILEVEAREKLATEGPWLAATKPEQDHKIFFIYPDNGSNWIPALEIATIYSGGNALAKQDAAFVAHARTDIPQLLAAVKTLMKENEVLREGLENFDAIGYGSRALIALAQADKIRGEL